MKKNIILYRDKSVRFTKNLEKFEKEISDNIDVDYGLLNNYSPSRGNLYNIVDQATRLDKQKEKYHFDLSIYHQPEDCPCHARMNIPMDFITKDARDRVAASQQLAELLQCSYYCSTHCQINQHPELDTLDVSNSLGIHQRFYGDTERIGDQKKIRKKIKSLGMEPYQQIHELRDHLIAIYKDRWMYGCISEFSLPFNQLPRDFDYIYFPLEVLRSGYLLTNLEVNMILATEKISVQILTDMEDIPKLSLTEPENDDNNSVLEEIVIDSGYDTSRFDGLLYTSTFLMHILGMEAMIYPENPYAIRIEVVLSTGECLRKYIPSKEFKPFSLLEEVLKLLEKQLAYNMR